MGTYSKDDGDNEEEDSELGELALKGCSNIDSEERSNVVGDSQCVHTNVSVPGSLSIVVLADLADLGITTLERECDRTDFSLQRDHRQSPHHSDYQLTHLHTDCDDETSCASLRDGRTREGHVDSIWEHHQLVSSSPPPPASSYSPPTPTSRGSQVSSAFLDSHSALWSFATGSDSPVRSASSVSKLTASMRRRSAGITSPEREQHESWDQNWILDGTNQS